MLKKQTVWLLTMLSLMIVLSVYYMTSDPDDLAYIDEGETELDKTATSQSAEMDDTAKVEDITNIGQDELFTTIRMELQNERSMRKERFKDIVASSNASTGEKNEALNNIDLMEQITSKESILQNSILEVNEYEDVLVRTDDDKVHVHVKVDELSKQEVVNIMQLVRDEFGEVTIDVNFQPIES